jgi:hypothetical protein
MDAVDLFWEVVINPSKAALVRAALQDARAPIDVQKIAAPSKKKGAAEIW